MKTIRILYDGKVQGVGFRASVLSLARGYDVKGWVKNLPDGRVEVMAEGDTSEVDDFIQGIRESHLAGHIEREEVLPVTQESRIRGFTIVA